MLEKILSQPEEYVWQMWATVSRASLNLPTVEHALLNREGELGGGVLGGGVRGDEGGGEQRHQNELREKDEGSFNKETAANTSSADDVIPDSSESIPASSDVEDPSGASTIVPSLTRMCAPKFLLLLNLLIEKLFRNPRQDLQTMTYLNWFDVLAKTVRMWSW
ncbi:unnamed protein product [Amoebophrya sp. A25]|nr:unnamed protein product [Amoebophrya sp. A25]|eukprot:GSA25T00026700001.1